MVYINQNLLLFLTTQDSLFTFSSGLFAGMFTFNQLGIVSERITATFFAKSYENSRKPLILFIILPVRCFMFTKTNYISTPELVSVKTDCVKKTDRFSPTTYKLVTLSIGDKNFILVGDKLFISW
jgi:hypothetical protein